MTENINNLIKELSEIYDSDSKDTFVSLYLSKGLDKKFLDRRIQACNSILKGEDLKNFNETIEEIKNVLEKNDYKNIAIFSSKKHGFLKYILLNVKIENLLIVDSSPYIRPLARINDEWESFTLVLINSNSSKIFSISTGKIDDVKNLSADIMNKHKKGGCSQARFNRLRKGSINKFLSEVVEDLQNRVEKQIIIAGPGITKKKFFEMLPKNLSEKVVDVLDIGIDDENELIKQSLNLISEKEKNKSHEAIQQLKQEILKDGLAVYGFKETLKAVKSGQVEMLIIEKDFKQRGWICENCQVVRLGVKKSCPYCGKKTSEVDVLEEILEFAERTDAEIEFTDDKEISNLGHIGAILRYK
jgi:peptide chain release factor subunit 1